jgi:hypothetical protein
MLERNNSHFIGPSPGAGVLSARQAGRCDRKYSFEFVLGNLPETVIFAKIAEIA